MILLDTNVISEPWKPEPNPAVVAWLDAQSLETLFLSGVTIAEILFGIQAMPPGRRREVLHDRLEGEVLPLFNGRILPFDLKASRSYADLTITARVVSKAIGATDGYTAAIALARNLAVATRDTAPFEAANCRVINPWRP